MSNFFGQLIGVVVETVKLPVDLASDIVTGAGSLTDGKSSIVKRLEQIKKEAEKTNDHE